MDSLPMCTGNESLVARDSSVNFIIVNSTAVTFGSSQNGGIEIPQQYVGSIIRSEKKKMLLMIETDFDFAVRTLQMVHLNLQLLTVLLDSLRRTCLW